MLNKLTNKGESKMNTRKEIKEVENTIKIARSIIDSKFDVVKDPDGKNMSDEVLNAFETEMYSKEKLTQLKLKLEKEKNLTKKINALKSLGVEVVSRERNYDESTYDFIDCASAYHYGTNLYYEEIFKRKLDKLQPLFMDVINDIYEKYKELMEISSLLEPSLETFSCYITIDEEEYDDIDEEEYDDIEDKSIIYFTPQKYVDTLSSYTHEKEDVVKCILYCFARQDEIPTELALLILSFIGFKRISLFEKYFELLDVDEGSIYCN